MIGVDSINIPNRNEAETLYLPIRPQETGGQGVMSENSEFAYTILAGVTLWLSVAAVKSFTLRTPDVSVRQNNEGKQ
jgi:hypothetical protein